MFRRVTRLGAWSTVYLDQAPQLLQSGLAEWGELFSLCCSTSLMEPGDTALQGSPATASPQSPLLHTDKLLVCALRLLMRIA